MHKLLFYTILTIQVLSASAQERFVHPAKLLTRFSFKPLIGGVMLIQAKVTSIPDTLNFILDTGSGGISLDSSTCAAYHIAHKPSGKTINGIAGIKEVDYVQAKDLELPGLSVKAMDFYINNYQILTEVYGEKIDGVIGYSFFSKYIVVANADSNTIEVYKPGEMKYPSHGTLLRPLFTTLPVQQLRISDSRAIVSNFYLDSGAGINFLLCKDFVTDSTFLKKRRKPVMTQAEGFGGKKQMLLTIIREVKVGSYTFKNVPTHIMDDQYNVISYPNLGGLLGNDILRRFNVVYNYPKREVYLHPNSHFFEPFDYAYTGLNLYSVENRIVVDDIIGGSPAERWGFKNGDILISVDNNLTNNLQQYKNVLQSATNKIKVIIARNGVLKTVYFKAGRIF
jgi:hypothetical protein